MVINMETVIRRVVVTGIGAVSPIGSTAAETWDAMLAGRCGIGPITQFDTTDHRAKLAAEASGFNPRDYMDKAETLRTDRFTQFAVASATQAVEDSGIIGTVPAERLAVYYGSGIGGIKTTTSEYEKLMKRGPSRVSPYTIPMMIANMASGIIAIRFGAKGAAMPQVTACASGSSAIGEALRAVRHGYADAVITGGSEAAICAFGMAGFANMQALSLATDPDAASLPFDRRRAGFVMGEGGAALILEEYEHAMARGAKIYGEVSGYGVTCDAYHMTALQPDGAGGAAAMKMAMEEAGYTDADQVYVNAHGTGTQLNDSAETKAVKLALGEEKAYRSWISSTKSMTGHMLGAAGAMEAIVCLLALQTGTLPPTIHLLEPDPDCDLNYVPNRAVQVPVTLCLSNSFGFGGHNVCLAFRKV